MPDLDDPAQEVHELIGGASAGVGIPSCPDVAGEQKIVCVFAGLPLGDMR